MRLANAALARCDSGARLHLKAPSAELRPNQKDCDSLPEYDVLDPILKAYIEEFSTPEAIAQDLNLPRGLGS